MTIRAQFLLFMIFPLMTMACAGHLVHVKGVGHDSLHSGVAPGSNIYVLESNKMEKKDMYKHVTVLKDVHRMLKQKGFNPSDISDADYYMVLGYGIGPARKMPEEISLVTTYASFGDITVANPQFSSPTVQPTNPVPMSGSHVRIVYDIWMTCKLIDAKKYKENKTMDDIWTGRAWISENHLSTYENAVEAMLPLLLDCLGKTADIEKMVKGKDYYLK
ncbi:MAG: hypothetical protein KKD44_20800 [Proteobacteria bacterium]|nr:hypothetical protein [Pseudomonadota bacterium]